MKCSQCGFSYIEEYADDKKQHRTFHVVFLRGVQFRPIAEEVVIFSDKDFQIVTITPDSSIAQRRRAYRIALRGKLDTNYDFPSYDYDGDPAMMFIKRIKNRAISFVVIEPIRKRHSWGKLRWGHDTLAESAVKPAFGIRFIWTLSFFRHKGLASHMIKAACAYLNLPIEKVAWSYPLSESGRELAMSICSDEVTVYN
ncbi:MAG: hypothetical protein ROW48_09160 [Bellilinea sp.]|jgi:hypothetical protein